MSGVYIPGMEMPKRDATFLVHVNGDTIDFTPPRKYAEEYHREREIYKLIPVPDHGDLIDRQALLADTTDMLHSMMVFGGARVYTSDAIVNAPTIIPASKEGET